MRFFLLLTLVSGCTVAAEPNDDVADVDAAPPNIGVAPGLPTGADARGPAVEQREEDRHVLCGGCVPPPLTLIDALDGATWRFGSSDGDEARVVFAADGEHGGTAYFEPVSGTAFPCQGEGGFSVTPSVFGVAALGFAFPDGCGSNFLEVESFTDFNLSGLLGQVTPMNGARVTQ